MTLGTADEQVAIFNYIKQNWDTSIDGQMVYENLSNPAVGPEIFYTSVVIVDNPDARVRNSIGVPRLISQWGFVVFTTYAPQDKGALEQKKTIDKLINLFDEAVVPMPFGRNIDFGIASPQTLGVKDGTYRVILSCPFRWDNW